MFSRMGSVAFKKDLTNIRILCNHLGNPQNQYQTIHVGGTNGKGSTSHMLSAILQTAGYKTGLYTSPHLYDFRERIKINGEMVTHDFVVDFVQRVQPLIEEIQPSFFEITVAMSFEWFAQQKVDVAVIEVGLGGRLDSTNIIDPALSIITNIGMDHMNMLGNTLEAIAFEKAGIIKNQTPVIIGEALPETKPVFIEAAENRNAPIVFAEEFINIKGFNVNANDLSIEFNSATDEKINKVSVDLPGVYQVKNVRTVLSSVAILKDKGYKISDEQVAIALRNTKALTGLMGRWELVRSKPKLVLEVAHNEDGILQILNQLQYEVFNKLHIIIGMVKDKDTNKVLAKLPADATYYFTQAHIPRALPASTLKAQAGNLNGDVFDDVNSAISEAIMHASQDDLIIVCGSIFLVAEVDRNSITSSVPPDVQAHR